MSHLSTTSSPKPLVRLVGAILAAVALVLLGAAAPSAPQAGAAPDRHGQPNIVVIQTDDQPLSTFSERTMPRTFELLGEDGGTRLSQYSTTTPNCCPSRASLLTGQYAHNHGITSNHLGYPELKRKNSVLPVWLKRAGYRTAHVGKFMNRYGKFVEELTDVAPGWDEWYALLSQKYYDYEMSFNGRLAKFGGRDRDYIGRTITSKSVKVLRDGLRRDKPVFLYTNYYSPHVSGRVPSDDRCDNAAIPDPRDYDLFVDEPLPGKASFNEQDVEDKPSFIRRLPRLGRERIEDIRRQHGCALAAMRGVDRGVEKIIEQVRRSGEMRKTAFFLVSDNGVFAGEHRLPGKKQEAYEEGVRVPFLARMPREDRGGPAVSAAPAANIDLAPTILDLARADSCVTARRCRVMDGRSLLPLLSGTGGLPANRELVLEFDLGKDRSQRGSTCDFSGIRTTDYTYVEHDRAVLDIDSKACERIDEREHYNLNADPQQLQNLAAKPVPPPERERLRELHDRLRELRHCHGIKGRDPRPNSGVFCE